MTGGQGGDCGARSDLSSVNVDRIASSMADLPTSLDMLSIIHLIKTKLVKIIAFISSCFAASFPNKRKQWLFPNQTKYCCSGDGGGRWTLWTEDRHRSPALRSQGHRDREEDFVYKALFKLWAMHVHLSFSGIMSSICGRGLLKTSSHWEPRISIHASAREP